MKLYETITAENWQKYCLRNEDDSGRCLVGHGLDPMNPRVTAAVMALFPERVNPHRPYPIVCFNDHPDTTIDDVLRVLKFADV